MKMFESSLNHLKPNSVRVYYKFFFVMLMDAIVVRNMSQVYVNLLSLSCKTVCEMHTLF
jgi:hypothetical protein